MGSVYDILNGNGSRKLSAAALKRVALLTMLIDHLSYGILRVGRQGVQMLLYSSFGMSMEDSLRLIEPVYQAGRIIGRTSFPVFCFLLVEGYFHTSSRPKYFLRLAAFAFLSEIPFDRCFFPNRPDYATNVFFTLAAGLLTIWVIDTVKTRLFPEGLSPGESRPAGRAILLLLVSAGVTLAVSQFTVFINTDYDRPGVFAIVLFYILHEWRTAAATAAWLNLWFFKSAEQWAFPSILLIRWYNGQKGKQANKYFFYLFYPMHLLGIMLLRKLLMGQ